MEIKISPMELIGCFWLAGLIAIMISEASMLGLIFLLFWWYLGAHLFFGPLDWYLIYKALKKLRR